MSRLNSKTRDAIREEIDRLWRRIDRLTARNEGRADVKIIDVEPTRVRAHDRGAHTRALITVTSGPGSAKKTRTK